MQIMQTTIKMHVAAATPYWYVKKGLARIKNTTKRKIRIMSSNLIK